jgi:hypothetical protein
VDILCGSGGTAKRQSGGSEPLAVQYVRGEMIKTDGPWGTRSKTEQNHQHISQAGVALDGSLIAAGSMSHPVDEHGHFPSPHADLIRISRVRGLRIVRCRASREPSGFLRAEEYGSELHLPPSLAAIIDRALKQGVREPVQVNLLHQDGQLSDSTSTIKTLTQPLTGWVMRIEEDEGTITVGLSATLHGTLLQDWNTSQSNYWNSSQRATLEVNFSIDPVTRIACYGSYVPALKEEPRIPALIPAPSGLSKLNIADAPVGTFAQFAISGDRWISFYESTGEWKSISITEHAPPTRTAQGVLSDSRGYRWPRIAIYGIDMDVIASAMVRSREMNLVMQNGKFGQVHYSHGSDGSTDYDVSGVRLDLKLDSSGLHFDYTVDTEMGEKSGEFYLTWELLLLRYPRFAQYMRLLN